MNDFLSSLSNKAIELVIGATAIVLLAIGRIIFYREQKIISEREEVRVISNSAIYDKLEAIDRANAQRFESLHRETMKQIDETAKENQRQFERLHDRFNSMGKG